MRKMMIFLMAALLIAIVGLSSGDAAAAVNQTDIPQVFITTEREIVREEYIPAEITIVDKAGGTHATIVDTGARIKIRGNSTAALAKKPFNIKLSKSESVLGMPAGKKWSMLANYLDTSLMRNKLSYDFAKEIGLAYSSQTRYADVWVNGKYNGNYLISVPVEVGKNRVDIDVEKDEYLLEISVSRTDEGVTYVSSSIHRFEINEPETPDEEQLAKLKSYLQRVESIIVGGDYSRVQEAVDIDSFVEFFIVQELFKNIDANSSSTRFYTKSGILYAGPLWDMDLTSGNISTYPTYTNYLIYNNWEGHGNQSNNSYEGLWALNENMKGPDATVGESWIGYLMKYPEFRNELYHRYLELQDQIVNLYKSNALGEARIDTLLRLYGDSFKRDLEIWPAHSYRGSELYRSNEKTFDESVVFLRNFLEKRNQWLLANMIPKGFEPAPATPVIKTADPTNATVIVNGKRIAFDAYNIEGNNYFKLRDLAMVFSGSGKQFEVDWKEDARAINLVSGRGYTPVGGELAKGTKGKVQSTLWTSAIYKDNAKVALTAYNIRGNNYFKLRDVTKLFNIGVGWEPHTKTIELDTALSYQEP